MSVKLRVGVVGPDKFIVDVFNLQDYPAIVTAFFAVFKFPTLSVRHFC